MSRVLRGETKLRQTIVLPSGERAVRTVRSITSNAVVVSDFGACREGGHVHIVTRRWGQDEWTVSAEHSRKQPREDRVGKLTAEDWAWLRRETAWRLEAAGRDGITPAGLVIDSFDASRSPTAVALLRRRTLGHLAWKLLQELEKAGTARTELGTGLRGGEARYFVHAKNWRE